MGPFLQHGSNLAFVAIVGIIAAAAGRRLCRIAGWHLRTLPERSVLALALGLALLSHLVFLAGFFGFLTRSALWIILLIVAVVGSMEWRSGLLASQWLTNAFWKSRTDRIVAGLIGLVACIFAGIVLCNLAPVTAADPMSYHLLLPRQYLYQGRIVWWPVFNFAFPQVSEMLYTLAMGASGPGAAPSMADLFTLVSVGAVWCITRRFASSAVAWLAAILWIGLPDFFMYATNSKPDILLTAFIGMGWLSLLEWNRNQQGWRWLVLTGIFVALALGVKIQALVSAVGMCTAAGIIIVWKRQDFFAQPAKLAGSLALIAFLAFLVMLPWYGRNWWYGHDPVWPLGFSFFHGRYFTIEEFQKFARWKLGVGDSFLDFLLGPWNLTTQTGVFGSRDFRTMFTPVFLAFLPAVILFWRKLTNDNRNSVVLLLAGFTTCYILWFKGGYHKLGYLFPLLLPLVPVTAWAIGLLWSTGRTLRIVIAGALCMAIGMSATVAMFRTRPVIPYITGSIDRESYLRSKVRLYDDMVWANNHLPPDAKVLSLELTPYYLERRIIAGAPAYSSIFQYSTVRSSADLLSRMKAQGITHIFAPTRPIEQTFAKASLLWPGTDLGGILQGLLDAGNVVQIYNNANARVVKSRAMGLSEKSECYIYKVRYNE